MGILDKLRGWMGGAPPAPERRFDNVRIVQPDGTTIEGHDAVKAHFDKEQELLDEHGSIITFQMYRINLEAKTIDDLQGERLAEIKVGGDFASGTDTVAEIKSRLRSLIEEKFRAGSETTAPPGLTFGERDRMSLSFDGRRMLDEKLFYADHFMLLPAWVQVLIHACSDDELLEIARKLNDLER